MTPEREVIEKIKVLKQIKPEKKWVFLTKEKILGKEPIFFPFLKPAFAGLLFILILFGLSFTSLPGEPFYLIKKIIERGQTVFVPEEEKPKLELELANKRLEELSKIAERNDVKKLAPAINEAKESVAQATKNLVKSKKVDREIAKKTLELVKKKQEVEKVLGTKITEEGTEDPTKLVAKYLIEDFENRTLTEDQKQILEKAKEYFENGDFAKVLELLLLINNK
jgi:RNase H-fold protein (predicted Holliday junction resolvase)